MERKSWTERPNLYSCLYKNTEKINDELPIKKGGDNWTSKGYIIPKGDLLNQTI